MEGLKMEETEEEKKELEEAKAATEGLCPRVVVVVVSSRAEFVVTSAVRNGFVAVFFFPGVLTTTTSWVFSPPFFGKSLAVTCTFVALPSATLAFGAPSNVFPPFPPLVSFFFSRFNAPMIDDENPSTRARAHNETST